MIKFQRYFNFLTGMKIIFTIQITAPLLLLLERAPLPLPPDFFASNEQWILWDENKNNIVERDRGESRSPSNTFGNSLLVERKEGFSSSVEEEEATRGSTIRSKSRRRRENWKCG